nr:MAG TPA: hypothetical protein [Caudoviricetes sp.]
MKIYSYVNFFVYIYFNLCPYTDINTDIFTNLHLYVQINELK